MPSATFPTDHLWLYREPRVYPGRKQPPTAFTLIELLATIAVLSILIAIILTAIGTVRTSATFAREASNLRQIGSAIQLWSGDNDGLVLPQHVSDSAPWDFENTWVSQLAPYLGQGQPGESYAWMSEIFAADWDDEPRVRVEDGISIELTYGYNVSMGCRYYNRYGMGGWGPGHPHLEPKRQAELNTERQVLMVAPRDNSIGWVMQPWIPGYSNIASATKFDSRGKTQILFTDGSVRTLTRNEAEAMGPEHFRVP